MAFRGGRGRGGGRGFGGIGGFRPAKQESFVLFPDIEVPDKSLITEEELKLVQFSKKLQQHFKTSPYFLDESLSQSIEESFDIDKVSNKAKKTIGSNQDSLLRSGYLILEPGNFPVELIRGTKRKIGKKVQWNPKQDMKKLDFLEQLEEKLEGQEPKSKKESGGEENEEDEENLEDEEEESDDGDYGQGEDFDDDEDDYNMADDGDDEAIM